MGRDCGGRPVFLKVSRLLRFSRVSLLVTFLLVTVVIYLANYQPEIYVTGEELEYLPTDGREPILRKTSRMRVRSIRTFFRRTSPTATRT